MKTINDQHHLHFFSRPSQLFMESQSSVLKRLGIFQSWLHLAAQHQFGRDFISDQSRKKSLPAIHFITFQILRSNMQNNEKCIQPQSETRSTNISNELSFVEIPTTSLPYQTSTGRMKYWFIFRNFLYSVQIRFPTLFALLDITGGVKTVPRTLLFINSSEERLKHQDPFTGPTVSM